MTEDNTQKPEDQQNEAESPPSEDQPSTEQAPVEATGSQPKAPEPTGDQVKDPAQAASAPADGEADLEEQSAACVVLTKEEADQVQEESQEGDAAAAQAAPVKEPPAMMAGVCLADGKVMSFDPGKVNLSQGDMVVVNNDRDLNLGKVVFLVPNTSGKKLRRVQRRVGPHDMLLMRRNQKREEEALEYCEKRIGERKLPMKLVQVAYLHGGNKAIFFFTADGRVDFRALVRDLAQQLHVRIEMRQIGVRDEAKLLGGMGICGQALCCARYLKKFVPVSIKMAKNQGLALNPQKVSGLCGRLMCCLVYEDDTYKKLRKGFPKVGKIIDTPSGSGKVVETDVLGDKVRVITESGFITFTMEEIRTGVRAVPETQLPMARKAEPDSGSGDRSRKNRQDRKSRRGQKGRGRGGQKSGDQKSKPSRGGSRKKGEEDKSSDKPAAGKGRSRSARRRRRRRSGTGPGASGAQTNASQQKAVGDASARTKDNKSGADGGTEKKRARRRPRRRRKKRNPGGAERSGSGGNKTGSAGGNRSGARTGNKPSTGRGNKPDKSDGNKSPSSKKPGSDS